MSLKVDLKSQEERPRFSFDFGWIFVGVIIFIAFLVFYFYGVKLQDVVNAKQTEYQGWKDKLASLASVSGQIQDIQQRINVIQGQINQVRELHYDPLRYSLLLTKISSLLPENLWLTSLDVTPSQSQVNLSGSAVGTLDRPPLASIANFLTNLQEDPSHYFSQVVLQGTNSAGGSGNTREYTWTFTVQASYNVPLVTASSVIPPASAPVKLEPQGGKKR